MSLQEKESVNDRNKELREYLNNDILGYEKILLGFEIQRVVSYLLTTIEYQQREIEELRKRLDRRSPPRLG